MNSLIPDDEVTGEGEISSGEAPAFVRNLNLNNPVKVPTLNPMPGRVIVQLVDRLTEFPNSALVMDPRYQYQPYIGKIVAFGDALDDEEGLLLNAARDRTAAGERFVFTWGNGTDYSTPQMMEFRGKDGRPRFEWLAKLRVFRIKDLAASISGGDELGGSDVGRMSEPYREGVAAERIAEIQRLGGPPDFVGHYQNEDGMGASCRVFDGMECDCPFSEVMTAIDELIAKATCDRCGDLFTACASCGDCE